MNERADDREMLADLRQAWFASTKGLNWAQRRAVMGKAMSGQAVDDPSERETIVNGARFRKAMLQQQQKTVGRWKWAIVLACVWVALGLSYALTGDWTFFAFSLVISAGWLCLPPLTQSRLAKVQRTLDVNGAGKS